MGLTSQISQWMMKTLPGMNNKVEDLELKTRWVEKAQNCRFEPEPGSVSKRDPLSYFNTASLGTGAVTGLYRFYTSGGVAKFIAIHGTQAYVGTDAGGTFTSIRTGLTDSKRATFLTYKNLLIVSNGFDNPWVYDGASDNVSWELGACKAVLASGGSNLDSAADYYYAVTMDNDAYVCGAVSNTVTTDASNRKVTLSNIPIGPVGTVNRKIYRVEGDGSALKLLATIADNTTTTYTDDVADGSLGAAYPAVTDDVPVGSIAIIHRERLFIAGDPNNPNRIYYSNPYLPHYIQQTTNLDYLDISPDDNDVIMGIPIQLGVMCVIKKNTIRKVHVTTPTSGADPSSWYADDPVVFNGTPAQWSIVSTSLGIVFLGWDHWYIFNGSQTQPIIDEFDTAEILPADYSDTVATIHRDVILAAFTYSEGAQQNKDRVMRYNLKRQALSYDSVNVSCFAVKNGDDESGNLFYGGSINGYVYLSEDEESIYRLASKTDVNLGTKNNVFVGGTEANPYLEIGATSAASAIPDDIVIFWDSESTTPGTGWTEITSSYTDKYIKISTTFGTDASATTHTHVVAGKLLEGGFSSTNAGGEGPSVTNGDHSHSIDGNTAAGTSNPRYVYFRAFKKNNTTTEYEFPDGAIVMYDLATAPTGYVTLPLPVGYYVRFGSTGLGTGNSSSHNHTFDITSSSNGLSGSGDSGALCSAPNHTHDAEGSTDSVSMDDWELSNVAFTFIKKVGETDTWDGASVYVYALFAAATAASNDWSEVTDYDGRFLKVGADTPTTGSASNASHSHDIAGGTSTTASLTNGNGGEQNQGIVDHQHYWSLETAASSADEPASITFRLFKKILGKMKDYNSALLSAETNGVYESVGLEINAETLKKLFWNESKGENDDIMIYNRTGATQSAVEDATACTATNATNIFTDVGHTLSNGNRVIIDYATAPTGISNTILYYVVGVAGNDFQVSLTSGGSAVTFTTDGVSVTYKKWSDGVTDPNGSNVGSTANVWFQYLIVFTAADTTVSSPKVSSTAGFAVKMTYEIGATQAETAVEFIYDIGFRNFSGNDGSGGVGVDKIYKKIISRHEGDLGSFQIQWETEHSSGTFTIDLTTYPERWDSFFPDNAMGTELKLLVYKNDLYAFRLQELRGLFTPEPLIV